MLLKDSKGEKSTTHTVFFIGALVAIGKLALSGVSIAGFSVPVFPGSEFALAIGALGGVYTLRRSKIVNGNKENENK